MKSNEREYLKLSWHYNTLALFQKCLNSKTHTSFSCKIITCLNMLIKANLIRGAEIDNMIGYHSTNILMPN